MEANKTTKTGQTESEYRLVVWEVIPVGDHGCKIERRHTENYAGRDELIKALPGELKFYGSMFYGNGCYATMERTLVSSTGRAARIATRFDWMNGELVEGNTHEVAADETFRALIGGSK